MTSTSVYKIIELIILFGAVAGFCVWQLRTVTKLQRERSEDRQQQSSEPQAGTGSDESARHLER